MSCERRLRTTQRDRIGGALTKHKTMRQLIVNADLAGNGPGWLLIEGRDIAATGAGAAPAELIAADDVETIDGVGCLLMPGAIDCHVHFRDPGLTHKADMATESRAALADGVTSFVDMPNTKPQTTTMALALDKLQHAAEVAAANYGVFIGATNDNIDELLHADYTRLAGVKLFMGSSTGNILVDQAEALERLFAGVSVPISVHAEDEGVIAAARARIRALYGERPIPIRRHTDMRPVEACVTATARAIALAERHGAHVHIAHVTTAAEVDMIDAARRRGLCRITCEVSPHHLLFCSDDYAELGARIKMNPAVKSAADRQSLREALADGRIDMIATDHAPHLEVEKAGDALHAVSGAPMVQFAYPMAIHLFGPRIAAERYAAAPARIFGITDRGQLQAGQRADLVLFAPSDHVISDADVVSRCAWTPLAGRPLYFRTVRTWLNGTTGKAEALSFRHS